MNHDSMVQTLARNLFPRNHFHFSGFHAHNAIACVFYVKNGYEGPKLLLALFLTYGSNVSPSNLWHFGMQHDQVLRKSIFRFYWLSP